MMMFFHQLPIHVMPTPTKSSLASTVLGPTHALTTGSTFSTHMNSHMALSHWFPYPARGFLEFSVSIN